MTGITNKEMFNMASVMATDENVVEWYGEGTK